MKKQKIMINKKLFENLKKKEIFTTLLTILVISNIVTLLYFTGTRQEKEKIQESANQMSFLNPARKLISQENLIVNFQSLRDYLNSYEDDSNISIYFEYLNTGANISINKDAQFWPASLLKVPVAMAVAKKVEKGEWKWNNKLVLMAGDKDEKFGDLYKQPTGSTFTIEELVRRVLADSDNTANFILVRNLELREIEDIYSHIGASDFFSSTGDIGAKKYSTVFRALYNSSYLSEENSQKLLAYLSETEFKEYLKNGLPGELTFAHKIGVAEDRDIYMDSGIVYISNRPYLLTVMINGKTKQEAQEIMKNISRQVYEYVDDYAEN